MIIVNATRVVAHDAVHENYHVRTEGSVVTKIGPASALRPVKGDFVFNAHGYTILPGFLDVHIHGGGGADTMDADPDALRTICRTHSQHGTTGFLLTTMTQSREATTNALRGVRDACETGPEFCPDGAQVLGAHLEGPYISPQKPGAQSKEFVRPYDAAEFAEWLETSRGTMKRITLAPEEPGASELIRVCRSAGIVVSLGHTNATTAQTRDAVAHGARAATHLFNAMPPLHHREPGPLPVFLTDKRVGVEIIADGHHVAPEVISLAYQAKGPRGVILITDAMAGAGAGDGAYDLGGSAVTVANGRATLADGTLAGSILTMDAALRFVHENVLKNRGGKWRALALLSSGNAATQMGWANKGRITAGADADFTLVDDALRVRATFVAGRCVWSD